MIMGRISLAEQILPLPFRNAIDRLLDRKGQRTKNGTRNVGHQTKLTRRHILMRVFAELYELGYKIQEPENLRSAHVEALMKHWLANESGAAIIQNKLCTLRMFAEWIGKSGMVLHTQSYTDDREKVRRSVVAKVSRAWEAKGVDPLAMIERASQEDPRVGLYLRLMYAFGLRLKEAICLKPLRDVTHDGQWLSARDGTKGGRQRMVEIKTDYEKETLQLAQQFTNKRSGTITPPGMELMKAYRQAQRHIRNAGISRDGLGVTAHGLRHQYAQRKYEQITGRSSPIQGGDPKQIDAETHTQACYEVMSLLGHSRTDVGGSYYGSFGHALRGTKKPDAQGKPDAQIQNEPPEDSAERS
jgi:site-specific recombinase XerD